VRRRSGAAVRTSCHSASSASRVKVAPRLPGAKQRRNPGHVRRIRRAGPNLAELLPCPAWHRPAQIHPPAPVAADAPRCRPPTRIRRPCRPWHAAIALTRLAGLPLAVESSSASRLRKPCAKAPVAEAAVHTGLCGDIEASGTLLIAVSQVGAQCLPRHGKMHPEPWRRCLSSARDWPAIRCFRVPRGSEAAGETNTGGT
jgi:hypothetical protein